MFKRKQKENKKKRPIWVRILKWSGIGVLFLLILIILAPFLFKPQIINLIEQTANDNLNAEIEIGDVKDPTVTTDFKEQLASLTGNMKDQLNELKDSLINEGKEIIEDKVEEVKEDLKAKRDEILANAQKQADKVKADAKTAADKMRAEADKQYEEAVKAAGINPVKKKAAELAAGKVRDKAYEKANDLETEANKKADKIMEEANTKANSLE